MKIAIKKKSKTYKIIVGIFAGILPPFFAIAIENATTINFKIGDTIKHNPVLLIFFIC
jgi:hypothetical protein